jgi:hypothetical protein
LSDRQLEFDLGLPPLEPAPDPPPPPLLPTGRPNSKQQFDEYMRRKLGLPSSTRPKPMPAPKPRPAPAPFNYTLALAEVAEDMIQTLDELRHIELQKVLFAFRMARQRSRHGVYATCTPMRFDHGSVETIRDGVRYRLPEIRYQGREMLYLVHVMLPRFHEEQDYHGKLLTLIHELYHISPHFNGDLRRFPGKNYAHGVSRTVYDAHMARLTEKYLQESARAGGFEFLRTPYRELVSRPGGIIGCRVARPNLIPLGPAGGK